MSSGRGLTSAADESEDVFLFKQSRLEALSNWQDIRRELADKNLNARPLKRSDHKNGYLELLSQLTVVGEVSRDLFEQRFDQMLRCNQLFEQYMIVVIEDNSSGKVVACSTLFLEMKVIRQCGIRGRLEDVCVAESCRGRKVGAIVVGIIEGLAREVYKCYKLTLDCVEDVAKFYEKIGFTRAALLLGVRY